MQRKNILTCRLVKSAFAIFSLIFVSLSCYANSKDFKKTFAKYSFTSISGDISTGAISFNDVIESDDGLLWIATNSSLLKFDGYKFEEINTGIEGAIYSLGLDSNDQLWLGSYSNATVYDQKNETFKHHDHRPNDSTSIPDESVISYYLSQDGHLWLGMLASLAKYNNETEAFNSFSPWSAISDSNTSSLTANNIVIEDIQQQSSGLFWLATDKNGLIQFDETNSRAKVFLTSNSDTIHISRIGALINLDQNNLLLATNDGLVRFNTLDNSFHRFPEENPINENVTELTRAPNGDIWVAGCNVYQIANNKDITTYDHELDFGIDENNAQVGEIYIDKENTVFVLYNFHGVYRASPFNSKVRTISGFEGTDNHVNVLAEASNERLWIGFSKGLIMAEPFHNGLKYKPINKINGGDFSQVTAIHEGLDGEIWIASDSDVTSISKNGEQRNFRLPPSDESNNEVVSIVQDFRGDVWISLRHSGIFKLNKKSREFTFVTPLAEQQLSNWSKVWMSLSPDRDTLLFVKSSNGYGLFDIRSQTISAVYKTTQLKFPYEKKFPLTDSGVWMVNQNSQHNSVYLSHNSANFSIFDWTSKELISKQTSVPRNVIGVIRDDVDENTFWLTSLDDRIYQWNETDGLLNEFKFNSQNVNTGIANQAGLKINQGTLVWGGQKGLFWLNAFNRMENDLIPETYITEIKINGKHYSLPNTNNLKNQIETDYRLNMTYDQNLLCIQFRGSSSAQPSANQFKYRLKGLHENWIATNTDNRQAMFINLPPGEYVFEVISSNNDDVWAHNPAKIAIHISPPWWQSNQAYIAYFFVIVGLITAREYKKKRLTVKLERIVKERTIQLQESKNNVEHLMKEKTCLTENIYHQTKTPLQLMLGNIDKLKKKMLSIDDFSTKQSYEIFKLSRLTEQILHISQADYCPCADRKIHNIFEIAEPILLCFLDIAKSKKINFHWSVDNTISTFCDVIDIERILQNVIENSIKYTESGGISVTINSHENNLIIKCRDSGIGIPFSDKSRIFDRYARASNAQDYSGSGIGLAIVKTIVDAYRGSIDIESSESSGTVFTIRLPIVSREIAEEQNNSITSGSTNLYIKNQIATDIGAILSIAEPVKNKPHILIVEDNIELSVYIKKLLETEYQISIALSAEDAMISAYSQVPDLIISDIMMGGADGFELTRQIRSCSTTNHIPIILVTAKSDNSSRMKGLAIGANDFVTKPFDDKMLRKRIENQLQHVKNIQNRAVNSEPQNISGKDRLIANYLTYVSKNYHKSDLIIKDICSELHVSSRQLEKKVKHFLNLTPNEYLNDYRLTRAREMLRVGNAIKQVYLECGFSSQSYFSKCYRNKFGHAPSAEKVSRATESA